MNTKEKIELLLYENSEDFEMAKLLKDEIKEYFGTLNESFATSGGKDFLVKHTKKIDSIIKLIYKIALYGMFKDYQPMKNSFPLTLSALGSYGREQLCVHSDIDLLIVYREIPGYNTREIIEKILYLIWDCGLKLGHRVHTVDELLEASQSDITIKTALIESRFVEGSHHLWTEAENILNTMRYDNPKSYIEQKLQAQHALHHKYPFSMEPNLKEGRGGFRDANLVYWLGKIRYDIDRIGQLPESIIIESEYRAFRIALEFLFRVRSALHLVAGKKEDRLRLDLIPGVASYLGYEDSKNAYMRFSKKVLSSLRIIYLYTTIWTDLLVKEYGIEDRTLLGAFPNQNSNLKEYLRLLVTQATDEYKASPALLQQLIHADKPDKISKSYYPVIRQIFQQPHAYSTLNTLSRARLLNYIFPPLKKIIDLPQFDGYHQFPVNIHLLSSVYHLEHIQDPLIKSLYDGLNREDREMLKLVTFFHDAGKGRRRDHSLVGASLFKIFANTLGYKRSQVDQGVILIQNHTLMSNIAQREDLYDEKNILKFASHFKTKKMLDMIYILTYADINGVSVDTYNTFTARLLHTLYQHSIESLKHNQMLTETAKRVKKEERLKNSEQFKRVKKTTQKRILSVPSNLLFLHYPPEKIIQIATEAFDMQQSIYTIRNQKFLTIEVTRRGHFHLGYLLSKLSRLNLVNMDICKLSDELKYFRFDFNEIVEEEDIPLIESYIERSFISGKEISLPMPKIKKDDISIDCRHAKSYAEMQLHTHDQKGLIASIITLFDKLGIDIVSAKIHTQKNRVRDLFLIEKNGNFCHNIEDIIKKIGMDS
ncbi:MAG: HD domain-containing protein [Campylobacterota bacterium]|nr:HD domain-containing protein [Campylobacterota bacterium]